MPPALAVARLRRHGSFFLCQPRLDLSEWELKNGDQTVSTIWKAMLVFVCEKVRRVVSLFYVNNLLFPSLEHRQTPIILATAFQDAEVYMSGTCLHTKQLNF